MNLYARDSTGKKSNAYTAQKGIDYFCLECAGRVRVRSGRSIRAHFYHIVNSALCRQAGKTEEHIAIQELIQLQIGKDKTAQEMRFDEIGRVADVAWPNKKLIFEVQCSFISQEEVHARNCDYASLGWSVVWVLYDKTFNQRRKKEAEYYLKTHTHYFSDASIIYDQSPFRTMDKYPISFDQIAPITSFERTVQQAPELVERLNCWSHFVAGDCLSLELKPFSIVSTINGALKAFWGMILERSCR